MTCNFLFLDDIALSGSQVVGLTNELNANEPTLLRIVDLTGREVEPQPNRIILYQYSDGTVKRKFNLD